MTRLGQTRAHQPCSCYGPSRQEAFIVEVNNPHSETAKTALKPMIVHHSGHLRGRADRASPGPRQGFGFGQVALREQCRASARL
jgi:hypothetical protein